LLKNVKVDSHSAPFFFDIDNDGDLDLLLGSLAGKVSVYERANMSGQEIFINIEELQNSDESLMQLSIDLRLQQTVPFVSRFSSGNASFNVVVFGSSFGGIAQYSYFTNKTCHVCNLRYNGHLSQLKTSYINNISRSQYYQVFTGFRCMLPICKPENPADRWQVSSVAGPCNKIGLDYTLRNLTSFQGKTAACEDYILNRNDSWCNSTNEFSSFSPAHKGGKITVIRGYLNSKIMNSGVCIIITDPITSSGPLCMGQATCVCSDGSRKFLPCISHEDCEAHMPGSSIQVLPEYSNQFAHSSGMAPFISFPSVGAKDFIAFSESNNNYLVVANFWSGCGARGYEQDSFVYKVNYNIRTYSIHQRFRTTGARGLHMTFRLLNSSISNVTVRKIYLFVANFRDRYDLQTESKVYEWTTSADSCIKSAGLPECAIEGRLSFSESIITEGAVGWLQFVPPGRMPDQEFLIPISSRSALSVSVPSPAYQLRMVAQTLIPVPHIQAAQVLYRS
jgi:hypothetical protein